MNSMSPLTPSKNVVLLIGVLVLGAAARYYGEKAYPSSTQFELRSPQNVRDAETLAIICAAAFAGALVAAAIGYRLNRVTAAVLGPVGAAVATAHYSSLLGCVLGAPVGLFMAWLGPRRMALIALALFLSMFIGVLGGYVAGAVSIVPVTTIPLLTTMLLVIGAIGAINVLVAKLSSVSLEQRRWRRITGRLVVATTTVTVAILSVPLGITLDSLAWLRRKSAATYVQLRPLDYRCFTHGLGGMGGWNAPPGFLSGDLLKLQRFDDIRVFQFHGGDLDDVSLELLCEWRGIVFLDIDKTRITDSGVRKLVALRWMQGLNLNGTQITGATFSHLPPSLRTVWIANTTVNDESLKHLAKLVALNWLDLANTNIGDTGVANLAGVRALARLELSGTQVSDEALASLAQNNPSIGILALRRTRITPDGLNHLSKLPKLDELDLRNCQINDDAIAALTACRSLRSISLSGTNITLTGAGRLREALPNCSVEIER